MRGKDPLGYLRKLELRRETWLGIPVMRAFWGIAIGTGVAMVLIIVFR